MSDLIRVVDLEVQAHIGVPKEERARAQKLLISLEMGIGNFHRAAKSDDITATVNYFNVTERVKTLVAKKPPRKLLETLAENIATDLLAAFPIKTLTVEIKKFILPDARWVSVQITRKKI
ncbi:MAG: dihydroneopterin aldolase [Methylacidiphilales bacterium]|nr:dihydroneopterin aldolase [Candidatus Methylacidiphilales bacterium]